MEAGAEVEAPAVVLTRSHLLKVRIDSAASAGVAVRAVRVAVVVVPGRREAAHSESLSPELLPWFPITRSSAARAATAAEVELAQRAPPAAMEQLVDWARSSAPAMRVAAATVERVVRDREAAVAQVA